MVELVLNQLNTEVATNKALIGKTVVLDGIDACAIIEMSIDLFKTLFLYQTDEFFDTTKTKFFTVYNPDFVFNPADARLDNTESFGAIAVTNNMDIKHDFLRYIALKLFGTHQAADLFINESELVESLYNNIADIMSINYASFDSLNYINGVNVNLIADTQLRKVYDYRISRYVYTYMKYTIDSFDSDNNLCRELMLQLLNLDPVRFQNIPNSDKIHPMPFIVGDTISFKIGINSADGQELITGVSPIPLRTYQIKIILKNTTYKTLPLPETKAIVNYINLNPFPLINFTNYNDLELYDYVLFKFSVYLQNAENNNVIGILAYVTGLIQIYPKAFNGITTFPFNNTINGNSNYEVSPSYTRMFYIHNMTNVNSAADAITITTNSTTGDFIFNIDTTMIVHFQVELQNNGKVPIECISSKNFDINFI
jgi:hypothetical protein